MMRMHAPMTWARSFPAMFTGVTTGQNGFQTGVLDASGNVYAFTDDNGKVIKYSLPYDSVSGPYSLPWVDLGYGADSAAHSPTLNTLVASTVQLTSGCIAYSTNGGVTWATATVPSLGTGYYVIKVLWAPEKLKFYALVFRGAFTQKFLESADGQTWTLITTSGDVPLSQGSMLWDGTAFIILMNEGLTIYRYRSTDCAVWVKTATSGDTLVIGGATAHNNGVYVHTATLSFEAYIWSSADAAAWTLRTTTDRIGLERSITARGSNGFAVVGSYGNYLSTTAVSTAGTAWTLTALNENVIDQVNKLLWSDAFGVGVILMGSTHTNPAAEKMAVSTTLLT